MNDIYGYVNGVPVYSRDEFIFKSRGFGEISSDDQLIEYAQKASRNWLDAGWHHKFEDFYLGDYALDEPKRSLTAKEYERLKVLQTEAIAKRKAEEDAQEWRYVATYYYADNSVEELYKNKYGQERRIMSVCPHGDY